MSTDLAVQDDAWAQLAKVTNTIAHTEFVPKGLRGNKPAIMACLLYGRDIGLPPMVALREIDMIDGTPSESATLVAARIRDAGHDLWWEEDRDDAGHLVAVTAFGVRQDTGRKLCIRYGVAEATDAGLIDKNNYRKYRFSMFWARAVTQLGRSGFSDVFLGHATYAPEELDGGAAEIVVEDPPGEDDTPASVSGEEPQPQPAPGGPPPKYEYDPDVLKPAAQFHGNSTQRRTLNWLNILVVEGRKAGLFTTETIYEWARLIDPINVRDDAWYVGDDGVLHWADLRAEAPLWLCSQLLDRIKLEHPGFYEEQKLEAETRKAGRAP